LKITVGTIIRWNNFPYPRYGKEGKARWFICMGFSGVFTQVAEIYLCTTTTQLHKFQGSGNRKSHDSFIFKTNQFPEFEQDCALDFDERLYVLTEDKIITHKEDVEVKGTLEENTLRLIYNRYLRSTHLSLAILNDIHDSFNNCGITGLKRRK